MQRNLWLFMILSAVCLIGWMWLEQQLWPRKLPQPGQPNQQAKDTGKDKKQPPVRPLEAVAVGSLVTGLGGPGPQFSQAGYLLATGLAVEELSLQAELKRQFFQSPVTQQQLRELTAYLVPDPFAVAFPLAARYVRASTPSTEEAKVVTLGGPGFYIQADLTTRGAGIQRLALPRFQEASDSGLPEWKKSPTGEKEPAPLELIPDDPFKASFLFYHYPQPDADHPLTSMGEMVWTVEGEPRRTAEQHQISFTARVPGQDHLLVRRTYTLAKNAYHIALTIEVQDTRKPGNEKDEKSSFRYQLAGAHGLPIEGEWYTTTFRNAVIGMVDSRGNLWRDFEDSYRISFRQGGDRVPEGGRGTSYLQYAAVSTQFFASVVAVDPTQPSSTEGGGDKQSIVAYARPTLESEERLAKLDRLLLEKGEAKVRFYAGPQGPTTPSQTVYLLPRAVEDAKVLKLTENGDLLVVGAYTTRGKTIITHIRTSKVPRPQLDDLTVRVVSEAISLAPGEKKAQRYLLYHGPNKVRQLSQFSGDMAVDSKLVDLYADEMHLRTLTDYRSPGPVGWFSQAIGWSTLLIFCTSLMHTLLYYLKFLVLGNEGLSIILLTVVVRGAMFPLSRKQTLVSQRMQELQPKLKEVQEKYKDDTQAKNAAVMELYRKHNVNPFAGCLPLLLQLPIFLGLYYCLQESISFRLAHFLWIENLAAPDMLFYWGHGFPWLTDPDNAGGMLYLGPYFNLLPIVAVVLMLLQQKAMMLPPRDEQEAANQAMMKYMMVFFGILFYKVAAGLTLYFIATTLWGLLERKFLPKKATAPVDGATAPTPTGTAPGERIGGKRARQRQRGKKQPEPEKPFQKVQNWWNDILKQAKKK